MERPKSWMEQLRTHLQGRHDPEAAPSAMGFATWADALHAAIAALDEAAGRMTALVAGQPEDAPAAALGHAVVRRLREHHDELQHEAKRWLGTATMPGYRAA